MTTVFISGSKTVSRLNPPLRQRLDYIVKCGAKIIIGDSNGADKAVQQYLAAQGYQQVVVYHAAECLNNLGNWSTRKVDSFKEQALIADAKCGVILWDGKSRDTLHTLRELLAARKKTLLYFAPSKTFHNLDTAQDLADFFVAR